jgi:hypothetical protein
VACDSQNCQPIKFKAKEKFVNSIVTSATTVVVAAALAGCASPPQASPEVQAQQLAIARAMLDRLPAQATGSPASAELHAPSKTRVSEAEIAQAVGAWKTQPSDAELVRKRDGFELGGRRVVDLEGRIVDLAFDRSTGNITYVAQTGQRQYVVRAMNVTGSDRVTLATAVREGSTWSLVTASGIRMTGDRLIAMGLGLVLARDNVLFTYLPGKGVEHTAAPDEFTLAAFQNGDVGSSGFVLLERTRANFEDRRNSGLLGSIGLGGVVQSTKRIGAHLGVAKGNEDYALFSIRDGKFIPLEIGMDEKQVSFYSNCYKRNSWLNHCATVESAESLFRQDGFRNWGHYFWRVRWFASPAGPVAMVMEGNFSAIDVLNLASGDRVRVFERTLGINSWEATQDRLGSIRVKARLGFLDETRDGVERLVAAN